VGVDEPGHEAPSTAVVLSHVEPAERGPFLPDVEHPLAGDEDRAPPQRLGREDLGVGEEWNGAEAVTRQSYRPH